jgi:hypothetical protein
MAQTHSKIDRGINPERSAQTLTQVRRRAAAPSPGSAPPPAASSARSLPALAVADEPGLPPAQRTASSSDRTSAPRFPPGGLSPPQESHLGLLQHRHNLLHRKALPSHGKSPFPVLRFCRKLTLRPDQKSRAAHPQDTEYIERSDHVAQLLHCMVRIHGIRIFIYFAGLVSYCFVREHRT